jgi:crossover junction endodeoxyribonuclease RusA
MEIEMNRIITLTLPYPPGTNNIYRSLVLPGKKMPIRVKTGQAKSYHTQVKQICTAERVRPFIGPVTVNIDVYRPRRVGDLDGTFKIVFDSLKGWAFEDDKQIEEIYAKRHDDKLHPRVEITIQELNQ